MKRLLLLIVPLLLLGVSFATQYTITPYCPGHSSSNEQFYGAVFSVHGTTGITLYSLVQATGDTCGYYEIVNYPAGTVAYTGTFDTGGVTTGPVLNRFIAVGTYNFRQYATSAKGACVTCAGFISTNAVFKDTGGLIGFMPTQNNVPNQNGASPISFVFSGNTMPSCSTTIYYNGTTTGFAGNNIYLNGLFSSVSRSGVDLVFTYLTNYFRAMFRQHL